MAPVTRQILATPASQQEVVEQSTPGPDSLV